MRSMVSVRRGDIRGMSRAEETVDMHSEISYNGDGTMNNDKKEFSFDTIGLKNDFMFCTVMRKAEFCKPFLEMLLGIPIRELKYAEKQMTVDIVSDAKSIRMDVYAGDEAGTIYNIEMQVQPKNNLPKRARYYQDLIDLNLLDKGHDYSELPNNIVIFVCDFDPFKDNQVLYTYENRRTTQPEIPLEDGTLKVFMNLRGNLAGVNTELRALIHYMVTGEATTEYTEALEHEIRIVRSNARWRREYMTLQEKMDDCYRDGRAEGLADGIKQGIKQGRELFGAVIRKLIDEGRSEELPFVAERIEEYIVEFGLNSGT